MDPPGFAFSVDWASQQGVSVKDPSLTPHLPLLLFPQALLHLSSF
jgi:hypothetical protein